MAEATTSGNSGAGVTSRLSLAGKLYAVFALFALLTAAITALSDYNTRRNAELTEAIETASRAALNVERVNSLVYAVVMESRGVYMSTEAATVKKFGRWPRTGNPSSAPMTPSNSRPSRSGSCNSSTSEGNWSAEPSKSAPPPAASSATTMPIARCVRRSTRTSKRCLGSMTNAPSRSCCKPHPTAPCRFS